ncbi:restriction endonuclease [Lysinibacillus sp. FSL M8-0216]|uniref:restriction endonuclease n=1 Tax=Lysinibacillus sp. FSL M8-0216 TaxID=2921619 RepID=UPI00315A8409
MTNISIKSYTDLSLLLSQLDGPEFDHIFWKQIHDDDDAIVKFDEYLNEIEASKSWPRNLNWKKGRVLEDFTVFLFNRFQDVSVTKNKRPGDNETDIEARFSEKAQPPFMLQNIGPKIICECKNKKSSSIDVGMVTKLAEIIPTRGANFGVFISILGMGGYAWRYGEGKRKKIMYSDQLPIISFTVDELKSLKDGRNFYTMIREKYYALVDEVDDETADIPDQQHYEYKKRLKETLGHLLKCEIISDEDYSKLFDSLVLKYGAIEDD